MGKEIGYNIEELESIINRLSYEEDSVGLREDTANCIHQLQQQIDLVTDHANSAAVSMGASADDGMIKQLIQNVDAVFWRYDFQNDLWLYVSPQVEKILGYEAKEWKNLQFWVDIMHPEDRSWAPDFCYHYSIKGESHNFEYRLFHKNGDIVWIQDRVGVEMSGGKPSVLYGVMIEITELKNRENELHQKEDHLNKTLEIANMGSWEQDLVSMNINVSKPALSILGIEEETDAITFEQFKNQLHYEDRNAFLSHFNKSLASGSHDFVYNFKFFKNNGTLRNGLLKIRYIFEGKKAVKAIGYLADITAQKTAERYSIENQLRLQSIIKILQKETTTINELLDYTLEEAIQLTNSKLGYIYFYSEEKREFVLYAWSKDVMKECSIVDPETTYQLEKTGLWGEAVRQKRAIIINDFSAAHDLKKGYPDGHAHLKSFLTIPVLSLGKIVAVIGVANKEEVYNEIDILHLTILMDSTWKEYQKRKVNELLVRRKEELELLNQDKDRFISMLGHDIRNPFNSMLGFLQLLQHNLDAYSNDKIKSQLEIILSSAFSIQNILNHIVLWAKSQSKKLQVNCELINLAETCNGVIQEVALAAKMKNIQIENFLNETLNIKTDPDLLIVILRNLIGNAIKYTHENGFVKISGKEDNEQVEISIADTGVGMKQKQLSSIFKVTEINPSLGTQNEKGVGLGLLISKELVNKMNGKIWVESTPGVGSTFSFTIPKILDT